MTNSEYLMLRSNYTDYRLYYQVLYNGYQNRPWLEDRMPTITDDMGTGAMGYVLNSTDPTVANNSWSVVINSKNVTAGYNKHRLVVKALQCPLSGCYVPPPPVRGIACCCCDCCDG